MPSINTQYAQTRYNLTSSPNRTVKHIVIHYTATSADAQSNCKYFGAANRDASADFFINKDGSIYQFNKDIKNYYSWHCGDGYGKYGITNAQSVGIENVSSGEDFTSRQISSLAGLVQMLMRQLNVPASNVVRHYDASRKLCPLPYIDNAKWKKLWQQITSGTGSPITGSDGTSTGTDAGTSTVNVMSIAYDREKDPLVLEFGYAAQVSSGGNMGTYLKAQQAKAKYPVSAINTADLLNDIFDIWHINATDGKSCYEIGKSSNYRNEKGSSCGRCANGSNCKLHGLQSSVVRWNNAAHYLRLVEASGQTHCSRRLHAKRILLNCTWTVL